jgi:uncharacterized protein YjbI with pentapeptide repeats
VLVVVVLALLLGAWSAVTAPPAFALGTVSGTVTAAEDGAPLAGITVTLQDHVYGVELATGTTGPDGSFSVAAPARRYKVRFTDPTSERPTRWSGGVTTFAAAPTLVLADGGSAVADIALVRKARLHGTVTATAGPPLAGVVVQLHDTSHQVVATTTTAPDGTWLLDGLADGSRLVSFVDPSGTYASVFWADATTAWSAAPVALAAGLDPVVDQALPPAAGLVGTAVVGGVPRADIVAVVLDAGDRIVGTATTGADGRWAVGALPPATYKVAYVDPAYFTDPARSLRPIVVPAGDLLLGLEAALAAGQTFAVAAGSSIEVGSHRMVGAACAPDVFVPGASLPVTNQRDRDLRGCDLTDVNLWGADLTGADLTAATISRTDLRQVRGLTSAQITATNHRWNGTKLSGTGLDLSGTDFGAGGYTLTNADLRGLDLSGARFVLTDLRAADLRDADLTDTRFFRLVNTSMYPNAYLSYSGVARVDGVRLAGADLTGADITRQQLLTTAMDWSGTDLTDTQWYTSDDLGFLAVTISYDGPCSAALCAGDLTRRPVGFGTVSGYLVPADLRGRDLRGAAFGSSGAVPGTSFVGADLRDVLAGGLACGRCRFGGADLSGADLAGATLAAADLAGARLVAATLTGADLTGAKVGGADLSGADLTGVTGNPSGGSTAVYAATTCPDGVVTDGVTVTTCVGHGLAA